MNSVAQPSLWPEATAQTGDAHNWFCSHAKSVKAVSQNAVAKRRNPKTPPPGFTLSQSHSCTVPLQKILTPKPNIARVSQKRKLLSQSTGADLATITVLSKHTV